MKSFIIGFSVDPQSPQNLQPAVDQAADRIIVGSAVGTDSVVLGGCPGRDIQAQARPLLYDMAEITVAGSAEDVYFHYDLRLLPGDPRLCQFL